MSILLVWLGGEFVPPFGPGFEGVILLLHLPSSPACSKGGGASGPHLWQIHTAKAVECPRWMKKEV